MNALEYQDMIFPRGEKASSEYFTGNVWIKLLVPHDSTFNCQIANVVFEMGARNNWHIHPGGQLLMATSGVGCYQERGKPIQKLQQGDVITIPPDVEHWHGASPESEFTHIAINTNTQKGIVVWLKPVTDDEYYPTKS